MSQTDLDFFDLLSNQFIQERVTLQKRQSEVLRQAVAHLVVRARWQDAPVTLLDALYDDDGHWIQIGWQENGASRSKWLTDSELILLIQD